MLRALLSCSIFIASTMAAQEKSYSICVAPYSANLPNQCIPGQLCGKGKIQFRIDNGPLIDWPRKDSRLLEKMAADRDYRLTVYVGGKPRESFVLRNKYYSDTPKLCLFISDLYRTIQLWERKRCPWCTCE